ETALPGAPALGRAGTPTTVAPRLALPPRAAVLCHADFAGGARRCDAVLLVRKEPEPRITRIARIRKRKRGLLAPGVVCFCIHPCDPCDPWFRLVGWQGRNDAHHTARSAIALSGIAGQLAGAGLPAAAALVAHAAQVVHGGCRRRQRGLCP